MGEGGTRRSRAWFGRLDKNGFIHRSWMKNQGFPDHLFDGRPVIGIANTYSELTPCNAHFRELVEWVKRGVYEAGGFPVEFPVFSNGESNLRPTSMLYRNLAAMTVEEAIRGNPVDGVVLCTGCDKTTPALLMGAASCDVPAIVLSGGPMLSGNYHGRPIGSGTDLFKFAEAVKAGTMTLSEFLEAESCMSRSAGHCMTMGTASTMNALAEAMGLSLPHSAMIPAVDSRRRANAYLTGMRAVAIVKEDLRVSKILTRAAFENAIRACAALGGSTNAVIHLLAIAGRVGVSLTLDDWDRLGRGVPTLVDLMPSGRFLAEDFFYAGGLPAVLRRLGEHGFLHKDALTINGRTIWENVADAPCWNEEVVRPWDRPLLAEGGIVVLRGNLAPHGAVLKPSAASPRLLRHTGRAVVFENIEHYRARIEDPALDVDESSVLVLKNCGPKGYPGMAEVGNMGLPPKLLRRGITDMVRVSDARMSGTAYGTVVLHVAPEAAVGGPLALVRDGDLVELDVPARKLQLHVDEEELARRRTAWTPPPPAMDSGYWRLFHDHVLQANEGCDFDFLRGCRGAAPPRDSH
ncbi:MAG: dihydroxy-acid dehydratase [Geminicoccaceae bacterium]|nr:dihydroxy-acid dehydratase [Geminicoccaceae bacterium]MCS7267307.1 dihydroxy-acid dehydratase [Geminicoccaceae bacterium]MCX7628623.1 dihydroxy-acid dehydratase [Geminicoccaceae bacterium]MDW8124836.1 IlvD/Edd family dehydratase [Geminicoccaceae bacterium]MDW8340640.1 IlvD/Edd family dehydratase [Geminicoccaceae bacterium]